VLRFLADENFNQRIARGLRRRRPELDVPDAYTRVAAGLPMPGVVAAADDIPIGPAIDDILLIYLASTDADLEGQVIFLPL
jgi:hypothetical protein